MAIVKKEKYLKDIAQRIGRGSMFFEAEDRPMFMMGGRQVFVSSVGYDNLSGEMAYIVSNQEGRVLPSAKGVRCLAELDITSLVKVQDVVKTYDGLRKERTRNLVNMETRMRLVSVARRPAKGISF